MQKLFRIFSFSLTAILFGCIAPDDNSVTGRNFKKNPFSLSAPQDPLNIGLPPDPSSFGTSPSSIEEYELRKNLEERYKDRDSRKPKQP